MTAWIWSHVNAYRPPLPTFGTTPLRRTLSRNHFGSTPSAAAASAPVQNVLRPALVSAVTVRGIGCLRSPESLLASNLAGQDNRGVGDGTKPPLTHRLWTVKPYQRMTRPGLGELDELASAIVPATIGRLGSDPDAIWRASEAHRAALPDRLRSALGIFYTPPHVAERLLDDLAEAGARFDGTMRFCDPACGGGAFLLPIARRIAAHLAAVGGSASDLAHCLVGIDIDPGGLEITRAALDDLALDHFGESATWDLRRDNTLRLAVEGRLPVADAVVGNPPFGRIRLTQVERAFFVRSLKGHANLYGLFLDVALRMSRGLIGYVMPTSWLSGDYFSAIRELVSRERPLRSLRFIESRSAVFVGVLQEMCLAVLGQRSSHREITIYGGLNGGGRWLASVDTGRPWFMARTAADAELLRAAARSKYRLSDYEFSVHTGPLVWNRHRDQLSMEPSAETTPIVWSDAVRAGQPVDYAASRRSQLHFALDGMRHLVLNDEAVLVKRTTAKEQARRVVAAPFASPPAVVENHLNVVTARNAVPKVPVDVLAALLNSEPVDRLFRSLSGSVAVSATELTALPLPAPNALAGLLEATDRDKFVLGAYLHTADANGPLLAPRTVPNARTGATLAARDIS
jgi:adenine-specific DNA-methyltransferase